MVLSAGAWERPGPRKFLELHFGVRSNDGEASMRGARGGIAHAPQGDARSARAGAPSPLLVSMATGRGRLLRQYWLGLQALQPQQAPFPGRGAALWRAEQAAWCARASRFR